MKDFLHIVKERGYSHQITDQDALETLFKKEKVVGYIGFDATADSFHVGNLVQIMMLRLLQKCGHQPIVLIGGATTKIGDPSGKDTSRHLLDETTIRNNIQSLQKVFSTFIDFSDAYLVNNDEWLKGLGYINFLRDYGRHFSINRMLTFDSIKLRLKREQPLSFLEFNYIILQAYDFLELYKRFGCRFQMGGSDQWGNIVNGIDLTRRLTGKEVFGLTSSLIMSSSGAKMGKTAQGAIWLNADKVSPYGYWQFWRDTEDADVGRYLKLFTELPLTEINRLEKLKDSDINEAKKVLANEATALLHGKESLKFIHQRVSTLFEHHSTDLSSLSIYEISSGTLLVDVLVQTGLCQSKSQARRLIEGQGVRLDDIQITDIATILYKTRGELKKLSAGKKHHVALKII